MAIQRNDNTQTQVAPISPEYVFQDAGTVGTSEVTINIGNPTASVLVKNTHENNSLSVKFKSSKNGWNTKATVIAAGSYLSIDLRTTAIKIAGSGDGTSYEVLATKE